MRRALLLLCAAAALGARPTCAADRPLTIFAAASLQEVLTEAGALYTKETGEEIRFSFEASGTLARQLERGAPADLFFSAHPEWLDQLAAQGVADSATRRVFARNRLVVAQHAAKDLWISAPEDLLLVDRLAIGDPATVPAGRYARQFLERTGLWDKLQDRLVFASSVRAALAMAEREDAGAAIVYASDVKAAGPVLRTSLEVPEGEHDPIVVEYVEIREAARQAAARRFLWVLGTPEARALLEQHGFLPGD